MSSFDANRSRLQTTRRCSCLGVRLDCGALQRSIAGCEVSDQIRRSAPVSRTTVRFRTRAATRNRPGRRSRMSSETQDRAAGVGSHQSTARARWNPRRSVQQAERDSGRSEESGVRSARASVPSRHTCASVRVLPASSLCLADSRVAVRMRHRCRQVSDAGRRSPRDSGSCYFQRNAIRRSCQAADRLQPPRTYRLSMARRGAVAGVNRRRASSI